MLNQIKFSLMNIPIVWILIYSFFIYIIGVIFAQKTILLILRIFSLLKNPINLIKDFFRSQSDRIFLFFVLLIPISTYYLFNKLLDLDKLIQFLIVEGTFFAVIYSILIKDNASKYRERPIIDVDFESSRSHCYHMTIMEALWKTWKNKAIRGFIPTYYVSVQVINKGKTMLQNVEVVLQKIESEKTLTRPFLPLNLYWSFKGEVVGIPPHRMSRIVNIIEICEPAEIQDLLNKLQKEGGGPDEKRYTELFRGFRTCSVPPNTLSDIFPAGKYVFYLVITASNAEPKSIKIEIDYDGMWSRSTSIEDMRSKNLKIKLLK